MKSSLIITGVYDFSLCKYLLGNGINKIGFDIRPTSFNFITFEELSLIFNKLGQFINPYFIVNLEDEISNNYILSKLNNLKSYSTFILSEHETSIIKNIKLGKFIKEISEEEVNTSAYLDFDYHRYISFYLKNIDKSFFQRNHNLLKWLFDMKGKGKEIILPLDFYLETNLYNYISLPVDHFMLEIHSGLELDYRKINYEVFDDLIELLSTNAGNSVS